MKWLGWLAAVLVGLFVLMKIAYPTYVTRYRITLDVADGNTIHSGSSVIETYVTPQPRVTPETQAQVRLNGQAVVVDLGQDRKLFALLKMDPERKEKNSLFVTLAAEVFDPKSYGWQRWIDVSKMRGTRELNMQQIPMLVRFRNIGDPKTVERVDPDDLARSFGDGVSLKRATLELVDPGIWPFNWLGVSGTPLTTGIVKTLPWLPALRGRGLDGNRIETIHSNHPLANSIRSGFFSTERF